jgi:hypothetical protein
MVPYNTCTNTTMYCHLFVRRRFPYILQVLRERRHADIVIDIKRAIKPRPYNFLWLMLCWQFHAIHALFMVTFCAFFWVQRQSYQGTQVHRDSSAITDHNRCSCVASNCVTKALLAPQRSEDRKVTLSFSEAAVSQLATAAICRESVATGK